MNHLALQLTAGTELYGIAYKKVRSLAAFCRLKLPCYQTYLSYKDAVSEMNISYHYIAFLLAMRFIVQIVAPAIRDVFTAQQRQVISNELSEPSTSRGVAIAMDAQWHSIGHSSRVGTVTAMSTSTRQFSRKAEIYGIIYSLRNRQGARQHRYAQG